MSYQSAELKLRNLAAQDTTMRADFSWPNTAGNILFQWFDRAIVQGDMGKPSDARACVTVRRISTVSIADNMGGIGDLVGVRLQILIACYNAEQARRCARDIKGFINSISLCSEGYFQSPTTAPTQNPNKLLNDRAGTLYELSPPCYTEILDYRLMNREDIPA